MRTPARDNTVKCKVVCSAAVFAFAPKNYSHAQLLRLRPFRLPALFLHMKSKSTQRFLGSSGNSLDVEWFASPSGLLQIVFYSGHQYTWFGITETDMASLKLPRNVNLADAQSAKTFLDWYNRIAIRTFLARVNPSAPVPPPAGVSIQLFG
jgi:hypothetical protein